MSDAGFCPQDLDRGVGSTCFHPVHDVDLVVEGTGSTCFHPVHDVDLVLDGAGGTCFHPEHEVDLFLHQSLSAIDAIELERCR